MKQNLQWMFLGVMVSFIVYGAVGLVDRLQPPAEIPKGYIRADINGGECEGSVLAVVVTQVDLEGVNPIGKPMLCIPRSTFMDALWKAEDYHQRTSRQAVAWVLPIDGGIYNPRELIRDDQAIE